MSFFRGALYLQIAERNDTIADFLYRKEALISLIKILVPFLFLIVTASPLFGEERTIIVKQIAIKGNRKTDDQTLRAKLKIKEGEIFSPEAVQSEIKNLYGLGYFDQIEAITDPLEGGILLTFVVYEKPVLVEILFEGNDAISTERLKDNVSIPLQTFLDKVTLTRQIETLAALYEKEAYYRAEIVPVIHRVTEEKVTLTFLIKEGEQAYIRKIRLNGVSALKEKKVKKAMETKEYFWLTSWASGSGTYQSETLTADMDRIKDFYLDRGYLQVQVDRPVVTISDDKKWFDITFSVAEGDRFQIGQVEYEGNKLFDTAPLSNSTKSRAGETFSKKKIGEDVRAIVDLYGEQGHIFANASPQVVPRADEKIVDITYRITEDDPYRLRNITIRGNDKTRDWVIRREIRQNEQEIVNTKLLRRSFQRLHNLNFFEHIDIVPQKVAEGEVDLNVAVQEKSTGTLILGGGYSSVDRLVGQFEVNQGNLFGKGQLLRARSEFGKRRTTYSLTFREPYLFDSTFSGQTDIFNQTRRFGFGFDSEYQERRAGGDLILGKAIGEHIHTSLSYTLETLRVFNVGPAAPDLVQKQAAQGKTITRAVGFSIARDTRDFIFDPKTGTRNALSLEYAGTFLGGDNDYYKVVFESGRFYPGWREHTFSLHGQVGYADGIGEKELPVGERFFVGGINTVRGFRFGKAGPLTQDGVIKGGNKELFFNAEYLIPLVEEANMKWVFFYDIGKAFDDPDPIALSGLRKGAGTGIRFISPIGPIRFEWGRNIDPKPGEPSTEFEFSIGTLF